MASSVSLASSVVDISTLSFQMIGVAALLPGSSFVQARLSVLDH